MGEKGSSSRTTVSVPAALHKRMQEASERINWSAVACRAFEAKLSEMAARKVQKAMSEVIQRLRGSRQRAEDTAYGKGERAARIWCHNHAVVQELRNLKEFRSQLDSGWEEFWTDGYVNSAYGHAERLFFGICPEEGKGREDAHEFWTRAVDDEDQHLVSDGSFVKGFAEAALAFWDVNRSEIEK